MKKDWEVIIKTKTYVAWKKIGTLNTKIEMQKNINGSFWAYITPNMSMHELVRGGKQTLKKIDKYMETN